MTAFTIVDEAGSLVSIDVLETATRHLEPLLDLADALLDAARQDPDFIEGALHRSVAPLQQPLVWVGRVPLRKRFVALYCRWRDGHRQAFAGSERCRDILARMEALSPAAGAMLHQPRASLYEPTLLDATGELCPDQSNCEAGRDIGPIIDVANDRMQFINIFETSPDRLDRLLDGTAAIMPIARKHEGYLRTALHRSLDGTKVANYGQYRRIEQIRAMYLHYRTSKAFFDLMLKDVTVPSKLFGRTIMIGGKPFGTPPELRCYTVERVVVAHA